MYGKHYAAMYTGSMVGSGAHVFAVWGYVIANARHTDSSIELNPRVLSTILGEPIERVESAITVLCAPDPHSRSQESEGRRMVKEAPFLYKIVNAVKYSTMRDEDARREYMRNYMKERRAEEKDRKQPLTSVNSKLAQVEVNVDVNAEVKVKAKKQLKTKETSTAPLENSVTEKTVSDAETGKTSTPDPVDMLQHTMNDSAPLRIVDGVIHVPKRFDPPPGEINGFAVWVDANRDMKRQDPLPTPITTATAKRIAKHYTNAKDLRKHFKRFLKDDDKFIVGRGFQLVDFEKNIEKYRNDPPKVWKPESQMTIDEIRKTNPYCVQSDPFEDEFMEKEVPLAQKNPRYIPGIFVYTKPDWIVELIPGRFAPEGFPDDLLAFLRDCGDYQHPNHEKRLAWHRKQQELDLKLANSSTK